MGLMAWSNRPDASANPRRKRPPLPPLCFWNPRSSRAVVNAPLPSVSSPVSSHHVMYAVYRPVKDLVQEGLELRALSQRVISDGELFREQIIALMRPETPAMNIEYAICAIEQPVIGIEFVRGNGDSCLALG